MAVKDLSRNQRYATIRKLTRQIDKYIADLSPAEFKTIFPKFQELVDDFIDKCRNGELSFASVTVTESGEEERVNQTLRSYIDADITLAEKTKKRGRPKKKGGLQVT